MTSIPAFAQNSGEYEDNWAAEELCIGATKAKLNNETCEAFQMYQALELVGYPSDTCRVISKEFIEQHRETCHNKPVQDKIVSSEIADEFCMEATKFRMKKEYCKSVDAYIKAKSLGFPNDTCRKAGNITISAYLSRCPGVKDVIEGSGGEVNTGNRNTDRLVHEGIRIKTKNDYCEAYSKFMKVRSSRYVKNMGEMITSMYSEMCEEKSGNADSELDLEMMCIEAVKFRMKKEYCNAYALYRELKKWGFPNESCQKAAERVLNGYADLCGERKISDAVVFPKKSVNSSKLNTNKFIRPPKSKASLSDEVKKAIEYSENVEELCMFAVKFKIRKETCNAFWMYNMALAQNGVGDICQKQGELFLSQHADECEGLKK